MKNIFLIITAMLLLSFTSNGQSKSDKMYDVLSNQDGVTNFSFSKNMADAININLDDDSDERT
ncbi:MAG: hypothetical protein JW833_05385, partial [Prolixibacteraceae bacterium]|nr:hypothetical protein [Prolixibacteraceae bacterium]